MAGCCETDANMVQIFLLIKTVLFVPLVFRLTSVQSESNACYQTVGKLASLDIFFCLLITKIMYNTVNKMLRKSK